MSLSTDSPPLSILLFEREPRVAAWIGDLLTAHGVRTQTMRSLADVIKATRKRTPGAIIVDFASAGPLDDPHSRMGPDHTARVLRQIYPDLCIIVLSVPLDIQMEELCRELDVRLITKPLKSADLLSALTNCGLPTLTSERSHTRGHVVSGATLR